MRSVHSFVTEVFTNLVNTFKTANDKSFEIKLGGDAQIHFLVKCVEVCDKGACSCSACNALQRGSFHLGIASFVEELAHGAYYLSTFQECFFDTFIYNEVYITLTETQFRVVELIISHPIFVLHDGKRFDTLAKQCEFFSVNRYFTCLRAEHETTNPHKVADIEQTFEHGVIQFFIVVGTNIVSSDIHLNTPFGVLQLHKTGLSHYTARHHTSGDAHFTLLVVAKIVSYVG